MMSSSARPRLKLGRWGAPIKTDTMEGVQVPNREGLASYPGPESCAGGSNDAREALTGERTGPVLSPEIERLLGADVVRAHGRPCCSTHSGKGWADPAGS
jgi:hypothetical protein